MTQETTRATIVAGTSRRIGAAALTLLLCSSVALAQNRNPSGELVIRDVPGMQASHQAAYPEMAAAARAQTRSYLYFGFTSVIDLLGREPGTVILAHGRWYRDNGAAELRRAFRWVE